MTTMRPGKRPRYAVHAGFVQSRLDGQVHTVRAMEVARLYRLMPGEWFEWTTSSARGMRWEDYIHLYPDSTGKYERPT